VTKSKLSYPNFIYQFYLAMKKLVLFFMGVNIFLFAGKLCAQVACPEARSGYAFAYDPDRQVAVLFGGQDINNKRLDDTWEWATGKWRRIDIAAPPARINATMVYDPVAKRMLMFGGSTNSGAQNDVWTYDGKLWTKVEYGLLPPARQLATAVYDKKQSRLILFGGLDVKKNRLGDTWVMEKDHWKNLDIGGPSPRASHAMVYDDNSGIVYLYGGYDTTTKRDFWKFQNGSWSEISGSNYPYRCHTVLVYDNEKNRLLMFGGFGTESRLNELWEYSGDQWRQITQGSIVPGARAEHRGVIIPGKGLLIFGGVIGPDVNTRNRGSDTWLYDGIKWQTE
jgi:Galactose oxidase, central domain/Kelch motif